MLSRSSYSSTAARQAPAHAPTPCGLPARSTAQVRGGKSASRGVGMTPGRSPAYGLLASPHPNRGMQQNVLASPGRQGGFGGGGAGGGAGGAGVYSGRVTTQQAS